LPKTEEENIIKFIQMMQKGRIVPLDSDLSIRAANVSRRLQLPMADSIIYATTLQYNAVLWTADKHFEHLPNVRYFDKTQRENGIIVAF